MSRRAALAVAGALSFAAPAAAAATPEYDGPIRIITRGIAGGTVSLHVPAACVAPAQAYEVTLIGRGVRGPGSTFVRVSRTAFFIDGRRVAVDRRAPFTRRFVVPAQARPESVIRLRARAFIEVRRGRSPVKSIPAEIRVCG